MPWTVGKEGLRDAVMRLDPNLGHMLHNVWNLAARGVLDAIGHKEGSLGGRTHAEAVEANLSAVIPDDWKGTRLSVHDLVVLSAAACLHDVGKLVDGAGDHGEASTQEIWYQAPRSGLPQQYAEVVAIIAGPHNRGRVSAVGNDSLPIAAGSLVSSPRLLAALLVLADALHADRSRVPDQATEVGGRDPDTNLKVRFRRRCRGWAPGDEGEVVLRFVLTEADGPAGIDVIASGLHMMEEQLADAAPILAQAGLPHRLAKHLDHRALRWAAERERSATAGFLGHYPYPRARHL